MFKKIVLAILLAASTFVSPASAFRIEGADWGDSRDRIIEKLEQKEWSIRPSRAVQMVEADSVRLGQPCLVQFVFNRSLKLKQIRVVWETPLIGNDAQKALTQRYGNPYRSGTRTNHFEWHGASSGEKIVLDYLDYPQKPHGQTVVVFDGGTDYQ